MSEDLLVDGYDYNPHTCMVEVPYNDYWDMKDKIERLNKFTRKFSDFIDDNEYWKTLAVNGENIESKVSHKWNELLYEIVFKGSDKE